MKTLGPFNGICRVLQNIWGLYRDNGKENGIYYIIGARIGNILGYIGIMEKENGNYYSMLVYIRV